MVAAVRVEEVSDSAKGWDNLSTNVMYDTYLVNGAAVSSVRAQGGRATYRFFFGLGRGLGLRLRRRIRLGQREREFRTCNCERSKQASTNCMHARTDRYKMHHLPRSPATIGETVHSIKSESLLL